MWMRRCVAVAGLVLIAATWRLWTPQVVFPQVPFIRVAGNLPGWFDWVGLAAMVGGLIAALLSRRESRLGSAGLIVFAVGTVGMVLVDQHRLQPWAYQLSVAAVVLACAPAHRRMMLLRVLTIGLYFHSAVAKVDFSFLETNGQQLVGGLLDSIGLSMKFWSPAMCRGAAAMLPGGELLVAFALAIPRTRRWGLYGSVVMHLLLLMALGPWGLQHKPAVLVWNVYFIVQNWLLFGGVQKSVVEKSAAANRWLVDGLVAGVVLLPLLEPWGRFDHWPAWAVYAAHPAKVRVYVDDARLDRLPTDVRLYAGGRNLLSGWREIEIGRWSLAALDVPIYPQDRFQLGVAIALAEGDGIRVVIEGRADRWTGERRRRELVGREALLRAAEGFWLNARPRRVR